MIRYQLSKNCPCNSVFIYVTCFKAENIAHSPYKSAVKQRNLEKPYSNASLSLMLLFIQKYECFVLIQTAGVFQQNSFKLIAFKFVDFQLKSSWNKIDKIVIKNFVLNSLSTVFVYLRFTSFIVNFIGNVVITWNIEFTVNVAKEFVFMCHRVFFLWPNRT